MQKITNTLIVFLLVLAGFSVQAKPASPLSVDIVSVSAVDQEKPGEFIVTARSEIEFDEIEIRFTAAKGTQWSGVQPSWQGVLAAGKEKKLRVNASLPQGGYINVIAIARTAGLPDLVSSGVYQLPQSNSFGSGSFVGLSGKVHLKQLGEQAVIEYSLD